jgi:hypothetical protein
MSFCLVVQKCSLAFACLFFIDFILFYCNCLDQIIFLGFIGFIIFELFMHFCDLLLFTSESKAKRDRFFILGINAIMLYLVIGTNWKNDMAGAFLWRSNIGTKILSQIIKIILFILYLLGHIVFLAIVLSFLEIFKYKKGFQELAPIRVQRAQNITSHQFCLLLLIPLGIIFEFISFFIPCYEFSSLFGNILISEFIVIIFMFYVMGCEVFGALKMKDIISFISIVILFAIYVHISILEI